MSAAEESGPSIPIPAAGESILLEIDGELYQINVGDAVDETQAGLLNNGQSSLPLQLPPGYTLQTVSSEDDPGTIVQPTQYKEELHEGEDVTYITLQLPDTVADTPSKSISSQDHVYREAQEVVEIIMPSDSKEDEQQVVMYPKLQLPTAAKIDPDGNHPDYEMVEHGSTQGQPMLIDKAGFTYVHKSNNSTMTYWRCSVRGAQACGATVLQKGSTFTPGSTGHYHTVNPHQRVSIKVSASLKRQARLEKNLTKPASMLVRETLYSLPKGALKSELNAGALERMVNREKQLFKKRGRKAQKEDSESDLSDNAESLNDSACASLETELQMAVDGIDHVPGTKYHVMPTGWHGKIPLLLDDKNYSYIFKKQVGSQTHWCCPSHPNSNLCPAAVVEEDGQFTPEPHHHNHQGQPEKQLRRYFRMELLEKLRSMKGMEIIMNDIIEHALFVVEKNMPGFSEKMPRLRRWATSAAPAIIEKLREKDERYQEEDIGLEQIIFSGDSEFELIPHGTQRGAPVLIDRKGFQYVYARPSGGSVTWRCSYRVNNTQCLASVVQTGNTFERGDQAHVHAVEEKQGLLRRVKATICSLIHRQMQQSGQMQPVMDIVNHVMESVAAGDDYLQSKKRLLYKMAVNVHRDLQGCAKVVKKACTTTEISVSQDLLEGDNQGATCTVLEFPVAPDAALLAPSNPDYEMIMKGSHQGKPALIDKQGYAYIFKRTLGAQIYWRCAVRNKSDGTCRATVIQQEAKFTTGPFPHDHGPNLSQRVHMKVSAYIKEQLRMPRNELRAPTELVTEALRRFQGEGHIYDLKPQLLERMVQRERQCMATPKRYGDQAGSTSNEESDDDDDNDDHNQSKSAMKYETELLLGQGSTTPTEQGPMYEVLPNTWQQRYPLLVEAKGYSYIFKERSGVKITWQCPHIHDGGCCPAFVTQENDQYTASLASHVHPAQANKQLRLRVKEAARKTLSGLKAKQIPMDMLIEETIGSVIQSAPQAKSQMHKLRQWAQKIITNIIDGKSQGSSEGQPWVPVELPDDFQVLESGVDFELLEEGSQMGRPLLIDSKGHCYCNKVRRAALSYSKTTWRKTIKHTIWRCSHRNSGKEDCRCTVAAQGGQYTFSSEPHNHDPYPLDAIRRRIRVCIQDIMKTIDVNKCQVLEVVDLVLDQYKPHHPWLALHRKTWLSQMVSRQRTFKKGKAAAAVSTESIAVDGEMLVPMVTGDGEDQDIDLKATMESIEANEELQQSTSTAPAMEPIQDSEQEFTIIPNGSQRGNPLLYEQGGFAYTYRSNLSSIARVNWACRQDAKEKGHCPASVSVSRGKFTRGRLPHNHEGRPEEWVMIQAMSALRTHVLENIGVKAAMVTSHVVGMMRERGFHINASHYSRILKNAHYFCDKVLFNPEKAQPYPKLNLMNLLNPAPEAEVEKDGEKEATESAISKAKRSMPFVLLERIDSKEMDVAQEAGIPMEIEISPEDNTLSGLKNAQSSAVGEPQDIEEDFEILQYGSLQGRPYLYQKGGHSYAFRALCDGQSQWECRIKVRGAICSATVAVQDGQLIKNDKPHSHPGKPSEWRMLVANSVLRGLLFDAGNNNMDPIELVNKVVEYMKEERGINMAIYEIRKLRANATYNRTRQSLGIPKSSVFEYDVSDLLHPSTCKKEVGEEEVDDDTEVQLEDDFDASLQHAMDLAEGKSGGTVQDSDVEFEVIPNGSEEGTPLLYEKGGFAYLPGSSTISGGTVWKCETKIQRRMCPASVTVKRGVYVRSTVEHKHSGSPQKYGLLRAMSELRVLMEEPENNSVDYLTLVNEVVTFVTKDLGIGLTEEQVEKLQTCAAAFKQMPKKNSEGVIVIMPKDTAGKIPLTRHHEQIASLRKRNSAAPSKKSVDTPAVRTRTGRQPKVRLDADFEYPKSWAKNATLRTPEATVTRSNRKSRRQSKNAEPVEELDIKEEPMSEGEDNTVDNTVDNTADNHQEAMDTSVDMDTSETEFIEPDTNVDTHEYQILPTGSRRGQPLLIDKAGYSYTTKRESRWGKIWRCSVRTWRQVCRATVVEKAGQYERGGFKHIHLPNPRTGMPPFTGTVRTQRKRKAMMNAAPSSGSRDPSAIDDHDYSSDVLGTAVAVDVSPSLMHSPPSTSRIPGTPTSGSSFRMTPSEPKDLDFQLSLYSIPDGFLKKDMQVDTNRHVIFATEAQVGHLQTAKTWYLHLCTKPLRPPFVNLLTILTYFKDGQGYKYVPLMFILMSRCTKKDFKKVFKAVCKMLATPLGVMRIVAPYDKPLWHALWKAMPTTPVYGCPLHWQQAIWAKILELGLRPLYEKKGPTYTYLNKVLTLPYIPAAHIPVAFTVLQAQAGGALMEQLLSYIDVTWITDTTWTVSSWCAFNKPMQTQQEVEWLMDMGKSFNFRMKFYKLIAQLHQVAMQVVPSMKPITQKKMARLQKAMTDSTPEKMYAEWEKFSSCKCTATQLLCSCSLHINMLP